VFDCLGDVEGGVESGAELIVMSSLAACCSLLEALPFASTIPFFQWRIAYDKRTHPPFAIWVNRQLSLGIGRSIVNIRHWLFAACPTANCIAETA
jgi:hypothetical protein